MKIYLVTYKTNNNRTCLIAESKAQVKFLIGERATDAKSINEIATDRVSVPRILADQNNV